MKTKFQEKYGWGPLEYLWLCGMDELEKAAAVGVWEEHHQTLYDALDFFYYRVASERRKKRVEELQDRVKKIQQCKERLPK